MRATLLDVLRCPVCSARLDPGDGHVEAIEHGTLTCRRCARTFAVEDGIPRLLNDAAGDIREKRKEMEGWVELARRQEWYVPDDEIDLALPFLSRDLGWENDSWRATEHSFSLLLERYVRPGMRVLEVGAAKCWAAQHLVPRGCEYVGSDLLVDENIGLGRGRLYERRVGQFGRVQADAEHLPFADGSFDLTYGVAVLHHAHDLRAMVLEMARVTRRGGGVAALNEGTRPLGAVDAKPEQQLERELGINEHVHTLPAYVWSFLRAGLLTVRVERAEGYDAYAGRRRYRKLMRLPGGRTAVTAGVNLLCGYSGISLYARKLFG